MKKLYKKLVETDVTMAVEPKSYTGCVYFYFMIPCYGSDPIRIAIDDSYDEDEIEDLLLSELDHFIKNYIG